MPSSNFRFPLQELLPPVWLQLLGRCVRSNQRCPTTDSSCGELALQQLMAQQTGGGKPLQLPYVRHAYIHVNTRLLPAIWLVCFPAIKLMQTLCMGASAAAPQCSALLSVCTSVVRVT
jgi:hypothetical protein